MCPREIVPWTRCQSPPPPWKCTSFFLKPVYLLPIWSDSLHFWIIASVEQERLAQHKELKKGLVYELWAMSQIMSFNLIERLIGRSFVMLLWVVSHFGFSICHQRSGVEIMTVNQPMACRYFNWLNSFPWGNRHSLFFLYFSFAALMLESRYILSSLFLVQEQ